MISLEINGKRHNVDVRPDVPLLWVIREHLAAHRDEVRLRHRDVRRLHRPSRRQGGAVLSDSVRVRPRGKKITTIEGLPENHPVKVAWIKEQVPQCGYCQPGQIMQAAALLAEDGNPSDEKIVTTMEGNLCRCGTYPYIRSAIKTAAKGGKRK